jgi:hypothetical protein
MKLWRSSQPGSRQIISLPTLPRILDISFADESGDLRQRLSVAK